MNKKILWTIEGIALGAGIGYLFYHSLWMALAGAGLGAFLFPLCAKRDRKNKEEREKEKECCELLRCLAQALRSGKSLGNALVAAGEEYSDRSGKESPLRVSWNKMCIGIAARKIPEEAFREMAAATEISELEHLADCMMICRENGGNLSDTVSETVAVLRDKQRVRGELSLLLARKMNEQRIMNIVPFGLIAVLGLVASEYLSPLFSTGKGRLLMTICLLLMGASFFVSRKISGGIKL